MYGGELIEEVEDRYGKIQVVDFQQQFRSLHFNTRTQQSSMLLDRPSLLVHKYTQAMMLPLCIYPVNKLLLLGVGAGSIVKYVYQFFPEVDITAVELREAVINLAHQYFQLPDPDERFTLYQQDALEWLSSVDEQSGLYELVLVDLFITDKAKDHRVELHTQIDSLLALTASHGVLVFNHLASDKRYPEVIEYLLEKSSLYLYEIKIDFANTILLVSRVAFPDVNPAKLYDCEKKASSLFKHYYDCMKPVKA